MHTAVRSPTAARPRPRRRRLLAAGVLVLAAGIAGSGLAAGATGNDGWIDAVTGTLTGTASGERVAAAVRAYDVGAQRWDARDLAGPVPGWTRWRTVRIDGVLRRYLLSVPAGVRRRVPLVLAFHGLGERATTFAAQTGLVAATRAAGAVLVLPESEGPAFNDGRLGAGGPHDDAFVATVIRRLVAQGWVDPGRVTVAGFSNGAGMAMAFAGTHPDVVAAVVSVDGEMIAAPGAPRPTGPVQAVFVHGTADPVQPWAGRRARGVAWPPYVSVLATVHAWVTADHAGGRAESTMESPLPPAGSPGSSLSTARPERAAVTPASRSVVSVTIWAPGPSGAGVSFYEVHGMGHRWPVSSAAAVRTSNDALEPVSATTIVVDTAASVTRESHRTVRR